MLHKSGYKDLHFYRNETGTREMEFLLENSDGVVPVEIKAGSGANLQSLKVTDDLTGPEGSIWVWAEAQEHYMKDMQFAILDHTGINGLKVFRNACDDVSTSGGVLTEYLFGTLSNSDNTRLLVYWGESVKGTRKVILRKMVSSSIWS